jgi:hypothetical protein
VAKTWTPNLAFELEHMEATLNYKIDYMEMAMDKEW